MNRPVDLPLPQMLKMPLRDAFRGLSTLTGEAFAPLASALPEQVCHRLGATLRDIKGMGAELIGLRVTHDDIRVAGAVLTGKASSATDIERCAVVLAFAWDKAFEHEGIHPLLSETLASARLPRADADGDASPGSHAASILHLLHDAHVIGWLPGLVSDLQELKRTAIDLHLFAIAIWLLSARAATMEEEMQLLDMALALTRALRKEVLASMSDRDTLAKALDSLSGHL